MHFRKLKTNLTREGRETKKKRRKENEKTVALVLVVVMMLALGATALAEPAGRNSNGIQGSTDARNQENGRNNEWIHFDPKSDDVIVIDDSYTGDGSFVIVPSVYLF